MFRNYSGHWNMQLLKRFESLTVCSGISQDIGTYWDGSFSQNAIKTEIGVHNFKGSIIVVEAIQPPNCKSFSWEPQLFDSLDLTNNHLKTFRNLFKDRTRKTKILWSLDTPNLIWDKTPLLSWTILPFHSQKLPFERFRFSCWFVF